MLTSLQPRQYMIGEMIQEQFNETFEVLYIMNGKVGVGYRLFNDVIMGKVLKERHSINDYAIICNKVSEFLYRPIIENVEGYAICRQAFLKIIAVPFWQKYIPTWIKLYRKAVQNPILLHREDMIE